MNEIRDIVLTGDTPGLVEDFAYRFSVEASSLGLAPGVVPESIATTLGNGRPLLLVTANGAVFTYVQELGCITLEVLND